MCFPPQPEESADNQLVLKVFPYFLFLSSLFLIATFVVYAMIPEIRNIHGNRLVFDTITKLVSILRFYLVVVL